MSNPSMLPATYPVTAHTDFVEKGSIFVAIKGHTQDGVNYVPRALAKGAKTIVLECNTYIPPEVDAAIKQYRAQVLRVDNARLALAQLSAEAAEYPANKLRIIGVTGTKGKTSTCFLLEHIFAQTGIHTALISTACNRIGNQLYPAMLTTPQPDYLHQFLRVCVQQEITTVIIEVAAQALSLNRVDGISFDGVIFTNFSSEHGEFYQTEQLYFQAKKRLLGMAKSKAPILINADNQACATLLSRPEYTGFGLATHAPWKAQYSPNSHADTLLAVQYQNMVDHVTIPSLCGMFNAYNALAAIAMAYMLNIPMKAIQKALLTFPGIPGRMNFYPLANGAECVVDYAHTPCSYSQVLELLTQKTDNLIVVFGAGGNRDKRKRPLMGAIAAKFAQYLVLTTDNPRSENPLHIINDIKKGIPKTAISNVITEIDRKRAIEIACTLSRKGSIVALLGKGPDSHQLVGTKKIYFNEAEIIKQFQ